MLLVVERVKPSSGSCHLRSDSYSVILPPTKLQERMDPFTHCAAVKQQAVFTWAILYLRPWCSQPAAKEGIGVGGKKKDDVPPECWHMRNRSIF